MMVATKPGEKEQGINPLDSTMTPAQVARRKFKSSLPRKIENRRLSAMEALGETFTLVEKFRGMIAEEGVNPDKTLHVALAYSLPEAGTLAATLLLPGQSGLGKFCNEVVALKRPLFLGVVFIQVDFDTSNPAHQAVSFCAQFTGGPEAEGRLLFAQKMCLAGLRNLVKGLKH